MHGAYPVTSAHDAMARSASETDTPAMSIAVPAVQLVSIEHPCIVRNFDKGFQSLGGEQQVKHVLDDDEAHGELLHKTQKKDHPRPILGVSLRPHDPLATKLDSTPVSTQNVLVKVTVPAWTGRKRKRGSDEAFTPAGSAEIRHDISAPALIRRARDNAGKYKMECVGRVETTHRFKNLPDLQIRNRDVPIMRELRQHTTTPDYDILKQFHIDLTPGAVGIDALPRPPFFIPPDEPSDDPFNPQYSTLVNKKAIADLDVSTTPRPAPKPKAQYAPGAEVPKHLKSTVETLSSFLDKRPISTRLVLFNCFPEIPMFKIDEAVPWVGYKPKYGPWKDCVVRHGVDPTSDPKYRFYQVVAVRPHNNKAKDESSDTHIFDGRTKTKGRTYQFCDISDPSLTPMTGTPYFRNIEEGYGGPQSGWYHNGTVAKMKVLMADKVKRMQRPGTMLEDQTYATVAALPEKIDEDTSCDIDANEFGAEARTLAMTVRKEALRLHGERAGQTAGGGEQEPSGPVEALIDPSLLGQRIDAPVPDEGDGIDRVAEQALEPTLSGGDFAEPGIEAQTTWSR